MRLLRDTDVIKAVDRHTREDGTLDDDISIILEEVKTAYDKKTDDNEESNADRIRSMTDEELAKFLSEFSACKVCKQFDKRFDRCGADNHFVCVKEYAEAIIGGWLKQPVGGSDIKVCKVYPTKSHCSMCVDTWESYSGDVSQMPDCKQCVFNTREHKIVDFVSGLFNTYALLECDGKLEKVLISRLHDIREVE